MALCGSHLRYAIVFSALVNLAYLAPTLYMLQVYDRVLTSGSRPTLLFLTFALAATLFVLTFLDRLRSRIMMSASVQLDQAFSARIFSRVMKAAGAGVLLRPNQVIRDFDTMRMAVTGPAAVALFDAPWIPIYIIVCFIVHPLIGWLTVVGSALLLMLAILNEQTTRGLAKEASDASAAGYAAQESAGSAADVVRALGMGPAFTAQFEESRRRANGPLMRAASTNGRIGATIRFLRLFLQSAALGLGAWLAISKEVSAGAVFASSMLAARAMSPIDQIVAQWRVLSAAAVAYGSVKEQLRPVEATNQTALPAPAARVSLTQAVVLSPMRDRILLNGISFSLGEGTVVGVIGASGAGKTTLLQLLANARSIEQGEIRLDGARYGEWDDQRLGRFIGYMPQDFALFPGTIKDNISRFDRWAGVDGILADDGAIKAAKAAGVHELILSLPQGYDTQLGPRGRGLSAGQQQRIALARALYGQPVLYVLDEPNSHADAEAEAALMAVIARLRASGALVVVSAHKLSLIAATDVLALLKDGRLERFGPRDQVLASLRPAEPAQTA